MSDVPETHYATTPDGLRIDYQVVGEGLPDIVLLPTAGCIDLNRDEPSYAYALDRLAGMGRLICLDYRRPPLARSNRSSDLEDPEGVTLFCALPPIPKMR